jgi:hypothetical protein
MKDDDYTPTNARKLADLASKLPDEFLDGSGRATSVTRRLADLMGEVTTAKQLAEKHKDQLPEGALDTFSNPAKENFEHAQGIEMALEIKIRDANEVLQKAVKANLVTQQGYKIVEEGFVDQQEDVADFLKSYTHERNELYRKLDTVMPSETIDELILKAAWSETDYQVETIDGKPEHEVISSFAGLVPKLIAKEEANETVRQLEADLKAQMKELEVDQMMDCFRAFERLHEINRHKAAVMLQDQVWQKQHTFMLQEQTDKLQASQVAVYEAKEKLEQLVKFRTANEAAKTKTAKRVPSLPKGYIGWTEFPKKSKTVEVSGTASVSVTATATAEVANENDEITAAINLLLDEGSEGFAKLQTFLAKRGRSVEIRKEFVANEMTFSQKDIIRYNADWLPKHGDGPVMKHDLAELKERKILGSPQVECICPVKEKGKSFDDHPRRQVALRAGVHLRSRFQICAIGQNEKLKKNVFDVELLEEEVMVALGLGVDKEGPHRGKLRVRTCLPTLPGWTKDFEASGAGGVPKDIATNMRYTIDDLLEAHDKLKAALPISATDVIGLTQDNIAVATALN